LEEPPWWGYFDFLKTFPFSKSHTYWAPDSTGLLFRSARLEVVVQPESRRTTTTELILPLELPTVEDELKVLSPARAKIA
jgi:hypothetical protein